MPPSHDTILVETVRARRARLQSALLHGGLAQRRPATDNVRRLVGSCLAAAVGCVGCIGFAIVVGVLADRDTGRGLPGRAVPPAAVSPATPGSGAGAAGPAGAARGEQP